MATTKLKTKDLKALMSAPIGGAAATVAKPEAKAKPQAKAKGEAKKTGLYFFQMTPAGNLLRAYFVAFITAQIGGLVVGKAFRLWPSANIRGHLDTGKVEGSASEGYKLTAPGRNYFTDPAQEADKDLVKQFLKAIKSGDKPKCYNYAMSRMAK